MDLQLLSDRVSEYLDGLVAPRPGDMHEMENYAARTNFPIIGPATGQLCYLITRLTGARRVFELGSGYGYSTAWFARAVQENGGGEVYHTVWDEKLSQMARNHLGRLGYGHLIRYHVGEAVAALRQADGPFDLIFNDIDKSGYPDALPVIYDQLRTGGVLITDNMLFHGRIFDELDDTPTTQGVREFTRLVMHDPAWITSIVPIRDGVLVAYKK